ncbi:MAG: GyrI-like domain-containing protein [Ignavibacteria bacterium]|nr:GyrI-like domain-containing protein [Ignavibacteria bacterium]
MKVFKGLLIAIVSIFILILIITVFLPSKYYVERKIEIQAPASIVYYLLDDFRNWKYWDTWWKLDTQQVRTYAGPLFGVNSKFSWKSKNKDVGEGEIQIVEEKPFELIKLALKFGKEMESSNQFRIMQLGDKILLTWSMEGELKFLGKWFRFFMDDAIGKDFEIGLKNIKSLAEEIEKNNLLFFQDTLPEIKIIYISDSSSIHPKEIATKFSDAFEELESFSKANNLHLVAGPIAINRAYSEKGYKFDACLPIENVENLQTQGRIKIGTIPKMFVLRAVYLGSYDRFQEIYQRIFKYMEDHKLAPKWNLFEMYYTDPMRVVQDDNVTVIYCPI